MPSFGPIYSQNNDTKQLIDDVLGYWNDQTFLEYDRGKRWFSKKEEYILVPYIDIYKNDLYVPVINTRGNGMLSIFVYPNNIFSQKNIDFSKKLAKKILLSFKFSKQRIITFGNNEFHNRRVVIYLKNIQPCHLNTNLEVFPFNQLEPKIQKTFSTLAMNDDLPGSRMLWEKYLSLGKEISDIYVAVSNNKILGMIGPLDTLLDPWRIKQLIPPYFEVSQSARKMGIGTKLWNAAMNWGYENGAKYLLIQAEEGAASDFFYKKNSLIDCGVLQNIDI